MMMIGNAACSIGPLYIWRNVCSRSQSQPDAGGGNFLKMGFADGEQWMTGHMYVFHNTLFDPDEWLPTGGLGGNRIVKHTISRNNILHVRSPRNSSLSNNPKNTDNNYDYDFLNGQAPSDQEVHAVRGEPSYAPGAGFNHPTKSGQFQLADGSDGVDAGKVIPNFNDGYTGKAPDMGAHERATPAMVFGVAAGKR